MTALLAEARKLTIPERIELVEAIWDSIAVEARGEDLPLSEEHRQILDQRLADLAAHPDDESPWEEVRARLEQLV
jgi:putative addiction module component (TIGR02574 family)